MIKTKLNGILTLILALIMQISFAQERVISGNVSDESGPLPGVAIIKKGTTKGTETNFDGNYSIKAKKGEILVFSFLSMKKVEKVVGNSDQINVIMKNDNLLDEVVVTAQGVKKEKRALGYSVATVNSEQLSNKPQNDVARALAGKVPGVSIVGGGGVSGAAANINIRGISSINGNNSPLFVIDGVLVSSSTNTQSGALSSSGASTASRISDIDPNNIASLSILKGLNATVLYGSQGRNGVVLITTKTGAGNNKNGKTWANISTSYYVNAISSTPDYQNTYGNGWQLGSGKAFSNWGPKFTPGATINHPYSGNTYATTQGGGSFDTFFPQFVGQTYEYKPYNSVDNFFKPGDIVNVSLSLGKASEDYSYSMSFSNLEETGFTPGSTLDRQNFSIGGSANLDHGLSIQGNINVSITNKKNPPTAGSTGTSNVGDGAAGVYANVLYTPRSIDLNNLPYQDSQGRSVYYRSSNDIQNPLWTVNNQYVKEKTPRVNGKFQASLKLFEGASLTWKTGFDIYSETQEFFSNKGGIQIALGSYQKIKNTEFTWDHSALFNYEANLNDNISLESSIGFSIYNNTFERLSSNYSEQLVFNKFFASNFVNKNAGSFYNEESKILGLFGTATFGYKKYLYLNIAGRNDWASTHEIANRSIFYPSTSISFIPTSAFPSLKSKYGLNYLKLRGGYATSANFANPYRTRATLGIGSNLWLLDGTGNPINTNSVSNVLANPNLKPELLSEIEIGLDAKLVNNRIGIDLSLYRKNAKDQIVNQSLDPSTGATSTTINAGELETKGIELGLNLIPIKNENFNWDTYFNFNSVRTKVISLPNGIKELRTAGPFTNLANFAIVGEQYNLIKGSYIQRDANNNPIVNEQGFYTLAPGEKVIGNPNPDFTLNFTNNIRYKNWNLGMQWDYVKGGDIYSATAYTLTSRGLTKNTDFDRSIPVILPGVKADGTPNDIQISANDAYWAGSAFSSEFRIYDATTIRLREISLTYKFTKEMLKGTFFNNVSLSLTGNNLWFKAVNMPDAINFDPEVTSLGVSNSRGFDLLTGPTSKRYGLSLNLSF
ncbi:SusC/RagA family TonB-linked outer membrane protein [uncultured Tenacibaculum sp.]|uniref:SusC/RagA family TonB-linked outer membrane protein n=1 Tax=uncultured Tenacibaculum sp. TaxID=174713 RepID=UPI002610C07B|nr:SusC/RagA family TonB-linked outer membrane protein [uncultured Tenacibaculum sp.]